MNGRTVWTARGRYSLLHSIHSEHKCSHYLGPRMALLFPSRYWEGQIKTGASCGVGKHPAFWSGNTHAKDGPQGRDQPLPVPFDVAMKVNRNFSPFFSRSQPRLPSYLFYLSIMLVCLQQVRKALLFISPGPLNPEDGRHFSFALYPATFRYSLSD